MHWEGQAQNSATDHKNDQGTEKTQAKYASEWNLKRI
jgi:hypothetical protein